MYVSNSSLLPFGWTAETLLKTHSSKPFNPDIARVFYRAGYIESWGRGIQKICDDCKNLGTDEPEYIVHGEDIMVKFHALQSAKVSDSKIAKGHGEPLNEPLEEKILHLVWKDDWRIYCTKKTDEFHAKEVIDRQFGELESFINLEYDQEIGYIDNKINTYYNLYATRMLMVLSNGTNCGRKSDC